MAKKNLDKTKFNIIDTIFLLAPFFYGIFPIWSCALLGIICLGGILHKYNIEKRIILPKGKNIYLIIIYIISFIITQFVAIDKGMNALAFIKNIPILLFIILIAQFTENEETKSRHFYMISISSSISVIVSLIFSLIPNTEMYLNSRLHGIFFYANSYGLFLLIGVLVLLFRKNLKWFDYLMLLVLFTGIILTNSRAIIVMTFVFILASLFFNKENVKRLIIVILSFILMFVLAYFVLNMEKRVSGDMLKSSEFISRIIYYEDAFNIIKNHPFGIGYEGFWYEQAKEQTAIYDTKFVHSSIIQVLLDIGWFPTIALSLMLLFVFFDKSQTAFNRIIMLAIVGHSLIDIDFEYLYFILIIAMFVTYTSITITSKKVVYSISSLLIALFTWIFIGDALFYAKDYKNSIKVIPFHSDCLQNVLYSVATKEEQLKYANEAIKLNKNVSGSYEALRNDALEKNDYESAIKYEQERLKLNKYKIENYMVYASLLHSAIVYYNDLGYSEHKEEVKKHLIEGINIESMIDTVLQNTNPLCYKTIHTPELEIPQDLHLFIENCKENLEKIAN